MEDDMFDNSWKVIFEWRRESMAEIEVRGSKVVSGWNNVNSLNFTRFLLTPLVKYNIGDWTLSEDLVYKMLRSP